VSDAFSVTDTFSVRNGKGNHAMPTELVTGNHAAGYALAAAGEANREARGACCGIYPITPQTEIVEYIAKYSFSKGRVIPVESEHSAMGAVIGASLAGARAFTASSSDGLAYMNENIACAGFYRCPIVMAAVNRTLGPPWNIWADQGDTLCLRDFAWLQFYCETNQEVCDTALLAFRISEDARVMLPSMVIMDAFIMSHTQMNTELPEQELVDRFLPPCDVPHRLTHDHPVTIGGLAWPQETMSMRVDIDEAFARVPAIYEEHRAAFRDIFKRDPGAMIEAFEIEDAERVFITSGTSATTTREVIKQRRARGENIGMLKMKMFRPFPTEKIRSLLAHVPKVGVLDRNYGGNVGGLFAHETKAAMQGVRDDLIIQDYLTGVAGGDVVPSLVDEVIDDLARREHAEAHVWKGIEV